MDTTHPLHIFRAGRHIASSGKVMDFTAADLAATAAAYDPALHEAPLVVGHPRTDGPAFGWVASLTVSPDGLQALPAQVDATFAAMVGEGKFKKISASFFLPDAPGNPKPGVYYLRHVGFLGAAEPAVKGLRSPQFSAVEGCETVEFSLLKEDVVTPEEKAALEAENARLKEQLAAAAAREKASRTAARHDENAAFAARLVQEGRLFPGVADALAATLDFMAAQEGVVEFAAADGKKPLIDVLKAQFAAAPVQIDFNERSADTSGAQPMVDFAAPSGMDVDAASLAHHHKALAYAAAHKVDYVTAAMAVERG